MLTVNSITKEYSDGTIGLSDFSLNFQNKGLYSITGESGSGKSTLLNIIATVLSPSTGEIKFLCNEYSKMDLDYHRRYTIGIVFQDFNLINRLTVRDNLLLSLKLFKEIDYEEKIKTVLKKLDLEGFENRKVSELSGGEIQRVAIARTIIKNPEIILLDEPTSNLDEENSEEIFKILKELAQEYLVIVSTHNEVLASKYSNYLISLDSGKLKSVKAINQVESIERKVDSLAKSNKVIFEILKINFKYKVFRKFIFIILISISLFMFLIGVVNNYYNKDIDILKTNLKYFNDEILVSSVFEKTGTINGENYLYYENIKHSMVDYEKGGDLLLRGVDHLKYDFSPGNQYSGLFNGNVESTILVGSEYNVPNIIYGKNFLNSGEIIITDHVADSIIFWKEKDSNLEYQDLINQVLAIVKYSKRTSIGPIIDEDSIVYFKIVGIKETIYNKMYSEYKGELNWGKNNSLLFKHINETCSKTYMLNEDYNNLEYQRYSITLNFGDNIYYIGNENNEELLSLITTSRGSSYKIKDLDAGEIILPKDVYQKLFNEEINETNYVDLLKNKILTANYQLDEQTKKDLDLKVIGYNDSKSTFEVDETTKSLLANAHIFETYLPSINYSLKNIKQLKEENILINNDFHQIIDSTENFVSVLALVLIIISIILLIIGLIIGYHLITFTIDERKKEIGIYLNLGISRKQINIIFLIEIFVLIIISFFVSLVLLSVFANTVNNNSILPFGNQATYDGFAKYSTYIFQFSWKIIPWGLAYLFILVFITFIIPFNKVIKDDIYMVIRNA